jgi:uncharacterized RDD family membrane protein YckC
MSSGYDTQRVTTADNVGISFRVAGLATRVTAALLDWLVLGAVLLAMYLLAVALVPALSQGGAGAAQANVSFLVLLLSALEVVAVVAYFTVSQTVSSGRTLGKSAMGIRVIRIDGGSAGVADCFLRSLALVVDVTGVGIILMFFHPQARRLGDLLAGTVVVRERTPVTLRAAAAPAPVYLRSLDPGPPIDGLAGLGERELQAVRTFLSRAAGRAGRPPVRPAAGPHGPAPGRAGAAVATRAVPGTPVPADAARGQPRMKGSPRRSR